MVQLVDQVKGSDEILNVFTDSTEAMALFDVEEFPLTILPCRALKPMLLKKEANIEPAITLH